MIVKRCVLAGGDRRGRREDGRDDQRALPGLTKLLTQECAGHRLARWCVREAVHLGVTHP